MPKARKYPVISAKAVLELQASGIKLFWGTSIPASGLKDYKLKCLPKLNASLRANIHPTTSRGMRREKPHITVKFRSTRHNQQTEQTVHINVRVWDPRSGTWTQYPSNWRLDNFPYHHVFQDGNTRFHRPLPKALAQSEINVQEQTQRQEERRREEEEERRRQEERQRWEEQLYERDDGRSRDRDRHGHDPRQYTRDSRDRSDEAGGSSGRYCYGGY
ncbi:hypothetical protein QBC43DRAFT_337060 [Cladorrhinum sp. PSN259]|nr:hypothetical protein QBC43DRAFT_337060 [Cladorrhinum sp. PSN259]